MQGGGSELLGIVQLPLAGLQERLLRMVGPSSGTAAEFGGNPRKERYPDIAMDTNRPIVNPIDARECGKESLHLLAARSHQLLARLPPLRALAVG